MVMETNKVTGYLKQNISSAPLVIFRIAFGALMFISICRFILKGWVHSMYVLPKMFFPYYGFEWIKPLPEKGMYVVFGLLLLASLGIMLGALYRFSAFLFFILFTYVELIDKTNYLNHYYFVTVVSLMMIFLPASNRFSLDNRFFGRGEQLETSRFFVFILQLQMFLVYFFAGVAKISQDWLLEAQPLKIWLPAFSHYYMIGDFMEKEWVAYFFSWFSCIYDLAIGFFLFNRRTVSVAYIFVLIFHFATALFFNIGMFPFIMITITIIFFREGFHEKLLTAIQKVFVPGPRHFVQPCVARPRALLFYFFTIFFLVQAFLPFRYLFYDGNLFWTEQGYRFSWRVMLMEKAGTAFFYVTDRESGRQTEIDNKEYLTYMQEKMMATQPDMMVDYAKFIKEEYIKKGYADPIVTARSYVTLNGCGSREFIDPTVDLASQSNSFLKDKNWVKSY
jgi:hypothetical protein